MSHSYNLSLNIYFIFLYSLVLLVLLFFLFFYFNVVDFFTDDFLMDCKTTCAINVILLIRFQHPNRFVKKVRTQQRSK